MGRAKPQGVKTESGTPSQGCKQELLSQGLSGHPISDQDLELIVDLLERKA